jgi:hypothetical protein
MRAALAGLITGEVSDTVALAACSATSLTSQ